MRLVTSLLDLRGWDAQPGGPIGLILGDQRAGDIVAVARPFLDRRGSASSDCRRRSNSMPASRLGWRVRVPELRSAVLVGELRLNCIPQAADR